MTARNRLLAVAASRNSVSVNGIAAALRRRAAFAGLALLSALGCAPTESRGADEAAEPTSVADIHQAVSTPLNPNDEFLIYNTRFRTTDPFYGQRGTFFADVNKDGKADAIAVNDDAVYVAPANLQGTSFNATEKWTNSPFWGALGTFFADVTGDGKADAIADDPGGVVVQRAISGAFQPIAELWSSTGFTGSHGTFFADVTGDRKADAITVTDNGVRVRRANPLSNTSGVFGPEESWTSNAFWGDKATLFADVTGDGKADAIAVNNNGVFVRRSDGSRFTANETWTSDAFYGANGTFAADVTADGLADIIAVNSDGVWLRRSSRFHFGPKELLTEQTFFGSPSFVDVNGDKRADEVETTLTGLWLSKSRTRDIKLRFVNFTGPNEPVVTGKQVDDQLARVNVTYAPAGIRFTVNGFYSVPSPDLFELVYEEATPNAALRLAHPYSPTNSTCYTDDIPSGPSVPDWGPEFFGELQQLNWVATRCAPPHELIVYIARTTHVTPDGSYYNQENRGFRPDHGKAVIVNPEVITDLGSNILGHELGHALGLEHPDDPRVLDVVNLPAPPASVANPLVARLAWDMVYVPNVSPFRASLPAYFEPALRPISMHSGFWCPGIATCPKPNAPLGTFMMPMTDSNGVVHYYTQDDEIMKGLALLLPDGTPTANVMYTRSQGNKELQANGIYPDNFIRAISLSQIEEIRRVLTFNVLTWVKDPQGNYISSDRPQLGR